MIWANQILILLWFGLMVFQTNATNPTNPTNSTNPTNTNKINSENKYSIIFLEKFMELFCDFKYSKPYFGNYTNHDEIKYYNIVFVNDYDKCIGIFTKSCEYFEFSWDNYKMIRTIDIIQIIPDSDIKKITGELFECIELSNKTIRPVENFFWERKMTNVESIITHWDQIPHDKKPDYVPGIIDVIHPRQLHQIINHFTDSPNLNQHHHKAQIIKSVNQNQAYLHKYKLDKFHHHITPTHIKIIKTIKTIGMENHNRISVEKLKSKPNKQKSRPLSKKIISQDISSTLYTGNSKSKLKYKQKLLVIILCALFGWCGIALSYLCLRHIQIWCLSRQIANVIHPETLRPRTNSNPN